MSMILYASPMSSATPVVHALAELRAPYELVPVDLAAGEQKRADFLALNPNGKVPTLVVDGTPMFEALAIMQWLGDRFGVERGMWPAADSPRRLEALSWTTWAYVTYGSALTRWIYTQGSRVGAELHHAGQANRAREELDDALAILDARLVDRPHLLGESFTLVDLIVASVVTYGTYCGVSADAYRNVVAWLARFQSRPGYKETWNTAMTQAGMTQDAGA